MEKREKTLLESKALLAAIYSDLRYRVLIPQQLLRPAADAFKAMVTRILNKGEDTGGGLEESDDDCDQQESDHYFNLYAQTKHQQADNALAGLLRHSQLSAAHNDDW